MITFEKNKEVNLYGAAWCGGCRRAKQFLDDNEITYTYIDVDTEEGKEQFKTTGYQSIPVLEVNEKLIAGFDKTAYIELLGE